MKHFSLIFAEVLVISLFFIPKQELSFSEVSPAPSAETATEEREETEQIRVVFGEEIVEMPLEEYVLGVVRGEMPASWPEEALKAQAVAARSYTLYQKASKKHENGDVCTDSTCCQAYKSAEEMAEAWGEQRDFYSEKTRACVTQTAGQRLIYNGAVAAAVYHASSIGQTNSAVMVWGNDVPYLIAVETQSEEEAKGHGVGMSQWGAKAMAENGKTHLEILAHYYPGTTVEEG